MLALTVTYKSKQKADMSVVFHLTLPESQFQTSDKNPTFSFVYIKHELVESYHGRTYVSSIGPPIIIILKVEDII